MTGAPKIRAMQIIEELEAGSRGVYSGVIGYLGNDGSVDLGMTIRTLVFEGGKATIGVGGGITIDSDPQAELAETKLKAKALLAALNAPDPWV
jgi:para-aminobenzoate synthetase